MRIAYTIRGTGVFFNYGYRTTAAKWAKLWEERISECRNSGLSVKTWCKEKGVCKQTYYKWQKKIFAMAKAQQELQFAEVTPVMATNSNCQIAVSIHAGGIAANIHNGADPTTVESVLRILKLTEQRTAPSIVRGAGRRVRCDFLHGNERTTSTPQMGLADPRPRSAGGQAGRLSLRAAAFRYVGAPSRV